MDLLAHDCIDRDEPSLASLVVTKAGGEVSYGFAGTAGPEREWPRAQIMNQSSLRARTEGHRADVSPSECRIDLQGHPISGAVSLFVQRTGDVV